MRNIHLLVFIQLLSFMTTAQSTINLGISYGRGFSYTKYSPFTRASGISAEFSTNLQKQAAIRFSAACEGAGPINYREQGLLSAFNSYGTYVVIPLRAGLQRFIYNEEAFVFAEIGAGIGFFPQDNTGETNTRVNPSYALGAGYRYHFNERRYLQGSLSYNRNPYKSSLPFSLSWMLFKVAYGIQWGNKGSH
jgi:hypothetical protein